MTQHVATRKPEFGPETFSATCKLLPSSEKEEGTGGDNQEEKLRMEQDVNMAGSRMNLSDSQESLAEAQVEKEEEELKAAIAMSLASMSSQ